MSASTEAHKKLLAPMVAYFDKKRCQREEKDITDRRFVASVQHLIRAEEQDQARWAERRRRRRRGATRNQEAGPQHQQTQPRPQPKRANFPTKATDAAASAWPRVQLTRQNSKAYSSNAAPLVRNASGHSPPLSASSTLYANNPAAGHDLTKAMTRVGQLRSNMAAAPDPADVALEMALLYLVLSDSKSALKSFRLALKPSAARVLTMKEKDRMEVQRRKLMLLDEERRNDALAVLRLEEEQGRRQREIAVAERRRCAATGAYQCLLDLKQPVAAAQAARMRLEMCETQNERVQVELEVHDALLRREGLIEPEATNQGAWLTESAGALPDLHASVLESLCTFQPTQTRFSRATPAPQQRQESLPKALVHGRIGDPGADYFDEARTASELTAVPEEHINYRKQESEAANDSGFKRHDHQQQQHHRGSAIGQAIEPKDDDEAKENGNGITSVATTEKTMVTGLRSAGVGDDEQGRGRLRDLGRILARKRQFAASRQAFSNAFRDGPEEVHLRETHRCSTKDFFLDVALNEASPSIQFDVRSRWQGGVATDETRRRELADFTGFTGVHRGAETVMAEMPAGGWADGASELHYADRFSRARIAVRPLEAKGTEVSGEEEQEEQNNSGRARATTEAGVRGYRSSSLLGGIFSGHRVPATDVVLYT